MNSMGDQHEDDPVCGLIPKRYTSDFTRDHQGESTEELTKAVDRLYKKHVVKSAK
jgi:hypothetical protein